MLSALLWDVDGTIAETELSGHRVAYNRAFAEFGLPWRWDVEHYGALLGVAGGRERLHADLARRGGGPRDPAVRERLVDDLYRAKTRHYAEIVAQGDIGPRPGVQRLVAEAAAAGVAQAVVTTTGRANVEALFPRIFGGEWRNGFATLVCAEDAPRKKPDPQAYLVALDRLGVAPEAALAIEDSPMGLAAATAAGVRCCICRSRYFRDAAFSGAVLVCDDLDGPSPVDLARLVAALA